MHTERYDFDTLIRRDEDGSAKWSRRTDAEKAAGIVPMSVADMEFGCAPEIVRAVQEAAAHGLYGYTDAEPRYYDAVCGWMQRRHGWQVNPEWIVPENGVVPAMCVAVRAFTEPGDAVLLQSPGYGPFTMAVEINQRVPVYSPLVLGEDGIYRMDLEDLRRKAQSPLVKMMFLCSPHNPVGRIWTPEELRAVADICRDNDVIVVSDEIHFDLELHGKHTVFTQAAPDMADRCVICTAPSKTFNLAGMQLANMVIPGKALRDAFVQRMNADGYSNASYFGYHATIAAYTEAEPWLDALLDYVRANFDFFGQWLASNLPMVKLLPVQGTYLAWTDWRALGLSPEALSAFLREDAMLVINDGTVFGEGGAGFARFNLALPRAELQKALDRLLQAAQAKGFA